MTAIAPPARATIKGQAIHRRKEQAVSEQEEDFAALFAASEKARKFSRGQMVEGTKIGRAHV